jgi:acylglycerol lipase
MAMTGLAATLTPSTAAARPREVSAPPSRPAVRGVRPVGLPPARTFGPDAHDLGSITLERGEALVPAARGVSLYRQWWRPCSGIRGSVVIVHGLKDHSARYGAFAERLVARGFAVHAFDLRGHARSGGARGWVDAFDDYTDDLEAVVRCVRTRDRRAPLFVFGHGMGGAIATLWALERAASVDGVILSAAALQAGPAPAEARTTRLLAALVPRARIFQLDLRRLSRDRSTVEDSLRDGLVQQSPAPARTARELLDAMARVDIGAPHLAAPLLVLHGSADVVNAPAGSERFVERAGSLDKQLYLYDGLAHDLLHEPERARVALDAADWLCERAPA